MSKFTDGPWKMHDASYQTGGSNSYRVTCFNVQGTGRKINNTFEYPHICSVYKIDDARLIAAAPLMYEALANLENDDGSIPAHAWQLVQAALDAAGGSDG